MSEFPTGSNLRSMKKRFLQIVIRGLNILDHVLRRGVNYDQVGSRSSTSSTTPSGIQIPISRVIIVVVICGPIYGLAMGSYGFFAGSRSLMEQLPQMTFSALKLPLLIAITLAVSLPSFFVINTLMGLRNDFQQAMRSIVSAQAGLTIILLSFLPLTLFFYVSLTNSPSSYSAAVLFNAAMFAAASISAQILLKGYYENLVAKNVRHRWMMRIWIFLYAFVGIQAAYVLRPFIGNPNQPTTFFRKESFENAYVKVWELVSKLIHSWLG